MTDPKQPVDKGHGGLELPTVRIDSMNLELRTPDGFLGDRANKSAFWDAVEIWRERIRERADEDPFGDIPTSEISKKRLEASLSEGSGEEAGLVLGAIETFANNLASVIAQFLKQKGWEDTQRIVIGGGMRNGRLGEIAIGRAGLILTAQGAQVELAPVRLDPHDAGLVGAAHLTPRWTLKGYDSVLGVDIGGTNIRAGVVSLNLAKKNDLSKARVWKSRIWRHADDHPSRNAAVDRLIEMLRDLIEAAGKESLQLAPFIGIGCPGLIRADGVIERGGQNLPGGNWESERFNLPARLREAIPRVGEHATHVIMHNDAVVQGLSQAPLMNDVERWGVLTIGTGLGNARFTNRPA